VTQVGNAFQHSVTEVVQQIATVPGSGRIEGTTGMLSVVNTWRLFRATGCWVGPIIIEADVDVAVQFALMPLRYAPSESDWTDPVPNPDDSTEVGVMVTPVEDDGRYGIWARGTRGQLIVVLEPDQVGYVVRT
jgi:hypothetical protein